VALKCPVSLRPCDNEKSQLLMGYLNSDLAKFLPKLFDEFKAEL
jgi:hypothetical protein